MMVAGSIAQHHQRKLLRMTGIVIPDAIAEEISAWLKPERRERLVGRPVTFRTHLPREGGRGGGGLRRPWEGSVVSGDVDGWELAIIEDVGSGT